ncbi:hypothetical protein GCM10007094_37180 [Pseudovibrio japonicus]|uniref:DUF2946 domain-containing protein n=1 Tax=Pseudovibrio japonicus TaxID=366534 RepID=A0ABQ3EPG3_9HYPH|nr:DUF2946 domain-containing protein [Pseudovibrio japonicus]GHB44421.1 hypothetical protein GCM10007094_37180 [Pseudovibrio japonicus]
MKLSNAKAIVIAALFVLVQLLAVPGMIASATEAGFASTISIAQDVQFIGSEANGNEHHQTEEHDAYTNCTFCNIPAKVLVSSHLTEFDLSLPPVTVAPHATSVVLGATTVGNSAPRAPPFEFVKLIQAFKVTGNLQTNRPTPSK